MAKPNLLLCFDAFGTLFRPKHTVTRQYAEVARRCGITGFTNEVLEASLQTAIKNESKRNPNYGKATGLGAKKWWTNIITNTFTPLLSRSQSLPDDLAPRLLHRFSSSEGYEAEPNMVLALKSLKAKNALSHFNRVVIGVITNSDDRVPSILSSLGLEVSSLRYGTELESNAHSQQVYDVDFHCMSYDVGFEKPDKRIFAAADNMLEYIVALRDEEHPRQSVRNLGNWRKIYVGDDYAKDVLGALESGWNPVFLDSHCSAPDLIDVTDHPERTIEDLFQHNTIVKTSSINNLATWLTGNNHA